MPGIKNTLTKRIILLVPLFVLFAIAAVMPLAYAEGDTGTYKILNYKVELTPASDGNVIIEYYQKWQVTGGHIPWITVGVPNDDYLVESCDLAAKQAYPDNRDDSSLVHIELDKDYQSGEIFEIKFCIDEQKLFYADGSDYKLDFTPGWYDRAPIDLLEIRLRPFVAVSDVVVTPQESSRTDEELIWTKTDLSEGEHFTICTSFPQKAAASSIPAYNMRKKHSVSFVGVLVVVAMIATIVWVVAMLVKVGSSGGYSGGRICRGGSYGGGCVHSCACACACAGCACACACAGGGGAGCSRKTEHMCKLCSIRSRNK